MREMSSVVRYKRRQRSSSCSSPDGNRRMSAKINNSENNASKHEKETARRRKGQSEDLSDSSSGHDVNRTTKKKKHSHHRKLDSRNSESEEENITAARKKNNHSCKENDRRRNKIEEDRSRPREKENLRCNQKKEHQLSSESRSSDHTRIRERHYEGDGGHKRDGGGGRYSDKRVDSSGSVSRVHNNDRSQEPRGEGHNRRNVDENNRKESKRRMHEGEERRKRWNDGGEGSRSGGTRGQNSNEGNQFTDYDRNRPIKQEPGDNNDESENYEWGRKKATGIKPENGVKKEKDVEKDKPNFGLSGKLTEDTNMVNGVVIKYSEPPEARKPRRRWRLYVFKGEENLPTLYLHRQSAFLIGRDRKVVDIPVDHPSCSKQHAAFQFRLVPYQRPNGTMGKRVRPYIIDLESANGTFVNNNKIDPKKYVELLERDVMKFGYSSREYVLLHEQSKESEGDDDDVVGT